jgi:hypothetical protein
MCGDCRGAFECAVCHGERQLAARKAERRERLREAGRRVAVVALVAASGATGLGAAFLPEAALCGSATVAREPAVELHLVNPSALAETGPAAARASMALAPTWGEPLVVRCFTGSNNVTCCVVGPR